MQTESTKSKEQLKLKIDEWMAKLDELNQKKKKAPTIKKALAHLAQFFFLGVASGLVLALYLAGLACVVLPAYVLARIFL
jgi:hypothetical protein